MLGGYSETSPACLLFTLSLKSDISPWTTDTGASLLLIPIQIALNNIHFDATEWTFFSGRSKEYSEEKITWWWHRNVHKLKESLLWNFFHFPSLLQARKLLKHNYLMIKGANKWVLGLLAELHLTSREENDLDKNSVFSYQHGRT